MPGLREYGLGNYQQFIISKPHLTQMMTEPMDGHDPDCPNCGMNQLAEIQVVLEGVPLIGTLLGGKYSLGTYLSCPACPWASPMVLAGIETRPDWFVAKDVGGKKGGA